jgi:hypothetical protein
MSNGPDHDGHRGSSKHQQHPAETLNLTTSAPRDARRLVLIQANSATLNARNLAWRYPENGMREIACHAYAR